MLQVHTLRTSVSFVKLFLRKSVSIISDFHVYTRQLCTEIKLIKRRLTEIPDSEFHTKLFIISVCKIFFREDAKMRHDTTSPSLINFAHLRK